MIADSNPDLYRPAQPVTDQEILTLSELFPALRFERTPQGALSVAPPTGWNGSIRDFKIARQLDEWNDKTKLGQVSGCSAGLRLPTGALYSPDACWVSHERLRTLPKNQREKLLPFAPDVVFELRSQSDAPIRLLRKLQDYIDADTTLAVLIDPYRRLVNTLFAGEELCTFTNPATLRFISEAGIEPLPGFTLDLRPIFELEDTEH